MTIIGSALVSSFRPHSPLAILWPKIDSFSPILLKIQLCLIVRGGVASFTNITGKVPTLVTFIGSLNFSVYRQILALTI